MEFQNFVKFDDLTRKDLSFLLAQYYDMKIQYKDFILLFREGEFFETYFEDALEFSNCTNSAITHKKFNKIGKVLMSGVPHGKIDIYIEKLINAGYKVAVADQTEEHDEKGRIIRKITKVYTQGTLLDTALLDAKENNYLASICKRNNKYEICYADLSVGDIFISSGNYEEIKCELARISPKELLLSKSEMEFSKAYKTEFLPCEIFTNGAYGSLLYYAKYILKEYTPKLSKPKNYSIEKNLMMDFITRKNLELTKNSYNNKKYGSILWAIDRCKTPMGKRLLSYLISTPLYDINEIEKRQKTIAEFLDNPDCAEKIGALLENTGDLLRLTSRLSNGTITALEFLTLKEGLRFFKDIENASLSFKSNYFKQDEETGKILVDYYEILEKTIEDDIELVKSEKYIKKGANADLDILETKIKEIEENILTYEAALRTYTKIDSLKIVKKSGECLIEIPIGSANNLDREFLHVQTLKNSKRYTTDKLISLQDELYSNEGKSRELRTQIFENLRRYSKEMTDAVRKYSKKLAFLDVFFSIYSTVIEYNLVCPVFKDSTFEIKNGKHIAAQKILGEFDPLSIDFKNSDFIILTGANGAGKSTLLKEIASIIILAQAGFYVPCDFAKLALTDRLFTVLNLSDEFINKKSSHGMQMHEVSKILQNTTDKSVILLDEIGKSTSYKEGVSISYGLIRYILEETVSKTIFATHYLQLADLFKGKNDRIKYLEIVDKKGKREIENGVAAKSFGILAASAENLPDKVIEYANYAMELV